MTRANQTRRWKTICKRFMMSQDTCALSGKPIDWSIKTPHPLSGEIDHIIPLSKGGVPFDMSNLQATHRRCNRAKSDKLYINKERKGAEEPLPISNNWKGA